NVIHILHGGASFGVSESAASLSSAFVHQALLLRLMHSNNSGVIPSNRRQLDHFHAKRVNQELQKEKLQIR
ncbi:MAG TPA: hypothetical protein VE177_07865, partial [Candidatus Binatus sp.]|nr:hypothetical protein [Candidatus Binatus sp.]